MLIFENTKTFKNVALISINDGYLKLLDLEKNEIKGELMEISTPNSKVKVLVVPTNEELMIARDTMRLGNIK